MGRTLSFFPSSPVRGNEKHSIGGGRRGPTAAGRRRGTGRGWWSRPWPPPSSWATRCRHRRRSSTFRMCAWCPTTTRGVWSSIAGSTGSRGTRRGSHRMGSQLLRVRHGGVGVVIGRGRHRGDADPAPRRAVQMRADPVRQTVLPPEGEGRGGPSCWSSGPCRTFAPIGAPLRHSSVCCPFGRQETPLRRRASLRHAPPADGIVVDAPVASALRADASMAPPRSGKASETVAAADRFRLHGRRSRSARPVSARADHRLRRPGTTLGATTPSNRSRARTPPTTAPPISPPDIMRSKKGFGNARAGRGERETALTGRDSRGGWSAGPSRLGCPSSSSGSSGWGW